MITFLSGGTGTPKLIQGFREKIKDEEIVVIANTADNLWIYGLYVCPDVDTIIYLFSGLLDEEKYWGIKNDTFKTMEFLKSIYNPIWFNLGDKDLAIHLLRTQKMKEGLKQSEITKILAKMMSVKATVFPATETHIETRITTKTGEDIHFQEFWVKFKGNIEIDNVYIKNIEKAQISKELLLAIEKSDLIVIGPSNPITSIGPIIKLDKITKTLTKNKSRCVAVSPLISNKPVSGPTKNLMEAMRKEVSASGVARIYQNLCDTFVVHKTDLREAQRIERETGMEVMVENILFTNKKISVQLADKILNK
ncbi:MAG: 2-phospho-L-lactate transferase [Candidatus Heimdallarchaeaceae archaeon]